MLGKMNVTTHDLEIKPCSSLSWTKHKLSQGNRNVSKPTMDRFECDDRNTDKPSSVTTQRPNMYTARSLRSGRVYVPLGRYVATEHAHCPVATEMELDCFPSSDVDKKRSNTDSSQAEQNHKSAG
ncbi:hypothetical protein F2Q68_00007948 [Brassica cretica]|uniref:Uncharacterized protein n=1 Tax=Brassica cretica TaxID=69181 RepID=A0A8S9KRS6_BRACR|nr:hypothetical protein F2Q68_00007948 [Brassica cretica]